MKKTLSRLGALLATAVLVTAVLAPAAQATPVCTDGYKGGAPRTLCGGRVFPEAENSVANIQFGADATGFSEFVDGMAYLQQLYPRWISVFNLADYYGDEDAVSAGDDDRRSFDEADSGDGRDLWIVKVTDHEIDDADKVALAFSLSIHGDEMGGREGGPRVVEDLAIAAENGGTIVDGVEGYESTTGVEPEIHEHEVADVLAEEVVYFMFLNPDGWGVGDHARVTSGTPGTLHYTRGNAIGTDLNRQMPTVGSINTSRNPLFESEMNYGLRFMQEIADNSRGGLMAYGADIHGESQSRAFADIMYPAGQFNSVKHRQLMAIAERTKSVIDATLFAGAVNELEENLFGGDAGEGFEDTVPVANTIPVKPARWGTVWDTLGYTDTGFIGDYLATELGVTGMDYEIAFNHGDVGREFGNVWSVALQENYINATRAIVTTAMAYALYQDEEFADLEIDTDGGVVGYVVDPNRVTDTDANGSGRLPGPNADGVGQNGLDVAQRPYSASQMDFFTDSADRVENGLTAAPSAAIAASSTYLDRFDSLVIADLDLDLGPAPADANGQAVDAQAFWDNVRAWVERGGNLVLTDRALHGLGSMGLVPAGDVQDINVYQPYGDFQDTSHPMAEGLRGNARQLAEFTLIGYGIGNTASPMTVVNSGAWTTAGGHVVATTGTDRTSIGQLPVGNGIVRILGGGLHRPSEDLDHRYGLKDYALTYSGLYVLENSLSWNAPDLGDVTGPVAVPVPALPGSDNQEVVPFLMAAPVGLLLLARRYRR